jgi:hypothetical protein
VGVLIRVSGSKHVLRGFLQLVGLRSWRNGHGGVDCQARYRRPFVLALQVPSSDRSAARRRLFGPLQ